MDMKGVSARDLTTLPQSFDEMSRHSEVYGASSMDDDVNLKSILHQYLVS